MMLDARCGRQSAYAPVASTRSDAVQLLRKRLAQHDPREMTTEKLTPAAVTLLLMPTGDGLSVVFTERAHTVEHHKGEISFPGGRVEADDPDDLAAALRETHEEIGVAPEHLELLGGLDDFESISGYRVRPYVVMLESSDVEFIPEPMEVAEVLVVPLAHLLDIENHTIEDRLDPTAANSRPLHFFDWRDKRIWGLTGAILHQFLVVTFNFGD